MNNQNICYKCVHQEDCEMFNADRTKVTVECGRFLMKDGDKAIMNAIYEEFFGKHIAERGTE